MKVNFRKFLMALTVSLTVIWIGAWVAQAEVKTWSKIDDASKRFQILSSFEDQAVLDKETGLIWTIQPNQGFIIPLWTGAMVICSTEVVAGRMGWRLPSIEELSSLIDTSQPNAPFLPAGHPFQNIENLAYWSSTTDSENNSRALQVNFYSSVQTGSKTVQHKFWCVRGGALHDGGK